MSVAETLTPTSPTPELTHGSMEYSGSHLEAAFISRVRYHRHRIMGDSETGKTGGLTTVTDKKSLGAEESEKKFQKEYGILTREEPIRITRTPEGVNRDLIVAVADNLAFRGIEASIIQGHLDVVKSAVNKARHSRAGSVALQGRGNGHKEAQSIGELQKREWVLKAVALAGNHAYRGFFDSPLAAKLNLASPEHLKKFLRVSSVNSNDGENISALARGLSLEIAAKRFVTHLVRRTSAELIETGQVVGVNYGKPEEDKKGGDIVVVRGNKILYIDLKNSRPTKHNNEEDIQNGYSIESHGDIQKATVWPESLQAVADDSFRLSDPALRERLQAVIELTR